MSRVSQVGIRANRGSESNLIQSASRALWIEVGWLAVPRLRAVGLLPPVRVARSIACPRKIALREHRFPGSVIARWLAAKGHAALNAASCHWARDHALTLRRDARCIQLDSPHAERNDPSGPRCAAAAASIRESAHSMTSSGSCRSSVRPEAGWHSCALPTSPLRTCRRAHKLIEWQHMQEGMQGRCAIVQNAEPRTVDAIGP